MFSRIIYLQPCHTLRVHKGTVRVFKCVGVGLFMEPFFVTKHKVVVVFLKVFCTCVAKEELCVSKP